MARHKKSHPAPKPSARVPAERSVLLRSAESIGRTIGLLQRQLENVTKRLATGNGTLRANGRTGSNGSSKGAVSAPTAQPEKRRRRSNASRAGARSPRANATAKPLRPK